MVSCFFVKIQTTKGLRDIALKNQKMTTRKNHADLIDTILEQNAIQSAIFDLDGTILDNNPYHLKSWIQYLKDKNITISQREYNENMSGRKNKDVLEYVFKRKLSDEEVKKYSYEKEAVYRRLYEPHFKEISGFTRLLNHLKEKNIKLAIATSGIQPNIEFMFTHLPVRHYFEEVVKGADVREGKPDPEIYLLTAKRLKVSPAHSLVFEDSIPGIESGKAAGMLVTALTTTHKKQELSIADFVIDDFNDLFV